MNSNGGVSRRSLLAGMSGTAALVVGAGALSGCQNAAPGSTSQGGSPVKLPTYQPITGVTADLPGTTSGVPDGFLRYPASPQAMVTGAPGQGGTVTALLSSFAVTPTPPPRNTYWAELNKRLNTDLQLQVIPAPDYPAKLATVVSGGQLPDMLEIFPAQPQLPQLLNATCADLTELLSGDAVKEFPSLAAFTTDMWRTTIFGNKIFGIPVPRPVQSTVPFVRTDLFSQRGLSADPKSWEEFVELCAALTNGKESRYALSQPPIAYLTGALGGANEWVEQDGKLVRYQETEQFRQALVWCAELNDRGYIHPDAFSANATVLGKQRLVGGTVGIHPDGFSAWGSLARLLPEGQQNAIGGLTVRGFNGATPTYSVGAGSSNFTAFKKGDAGRIRELLMVANYLATPFGSAEFLFRKFGSAGAQHTMTDGNPTLSKQGTDEITPVTEALDYHLVDGVKVAYEGSLTEITQAKHAFAVAAEPGYVRSAVLGLYSETFARKNSTFAKTLTDVQNGIITGRQPITALDDALKSWNDGDGQQVKREFAEAKQAQ